jgi:uncharacterized protein (DUF2141 family)
MLKFASATATVALTLFASAAGAYARPIGPEAAVCERGGEPAVLVRVEGFKQRSGTVRVQVYGDNPDDFLAKGRKLKRVDLPVAREGVMDVCVGLPKPGNYAIAVRHDVDGNGKSSWNDGGGFSRNPHLTIFSYKPDYKDVVIAVGREPKPVDVVLNYKQGFSIGPVKGSR